MNQHIVNTISSSFKISYISIIAISIILFNCDTRDNKENCLNSERIVFNFSHSNFDFGNQENLVIDNIHLGHSYYLDSIKTGFYLPKEEIILFQVENKIAKQKTNQITYSRALWSVLEDSEIYRILNYPKLITTGVLEIERKDGNPIKVCSSKKYLKFVSSIQN